MAMKEVVFVYLGSKPAKYIKPSLELACLYGGVKVTLIAEGSLKRKWQSSQINFVELEDFYKSEKFNNTKQKIILDHTFRNGFWLHTLERFFVLEQFMNVSAQDSIFHAELDQLLFGVGNLIAELESKDFKGLYFPLHNLNKAVASVLYCNSKAALETLTDRACMGPSYSNEMELLIDWATEYSEYFCALPTLSEVNPNKSPIKLSNGFTVVDHRSIGGIVDAAELGLWIGGRDPRNLSLRHRPTNKFTYPENRSALSKDLLKSLKFILNSDSKQLFVQLMDNTELIRIYNLHLQSKIHPWLASNNSNLIYMLNTSSSINTISFPGTQRTQIIYAAGVIIGRIRKEKMKYIYQKTIEYSQLIYRTIKNNFRFNK